MAHIDPEKRLASKRRWQKKKHEEKYGIGSGDMRGKHGNHARGKNHPKWKTGIHSSTGYTKIRVGVSHPLADPKGYAYEHLIVWVSAGNNRPRDGEMLHHRNGNKTDNRIENLELISRKNHHLYHQRGHHGKFAAGLADRPEMAGKHLIPADLMIREYPKVGGGGGS